MLSACANGFGAVALAALLGEEGRADTKSANPMAPQPGHFPAKTKSVIFLFMDGGPSHIDTFDPKPRLIKEHGQPYQGTIQPSQFMSRGAVLKSPWEFKPYGQSGIPVSDLLDTTLVIWAGEFGRTPMAQGNDGRDHNPYGFSIWMAGGGVKGGKIYGATDDYGYHAVENRVSIHDLHATMLHLLGVDHKRLTYRYSGRDMRLTDVYGEVVRDILA